jgi:hypothetical protein
MLIEVDPAQTSTLDSRTGNFGMRARVISADKFMPLPWIRKKVEEAKGRSEKGTALAEDLLWISIDNRLKSLSKSDLAKNVNALTPPKAACNIGLRALPLLAGLMGSISFWLTETIS